MKDPIFFISKHKNLSSTNSFGGYKTYYFDGQIKEEVNYINDKLNG